MTAAAGFFIVWLITSLPILIIIGNCIQWGQRDDE